MPGNQQKNPNEGRANRRAGSKRAGISIIWNTCSRPSIGSNPTELNKIQCRADEMATESGREKMDKPGIPGNFEGWPKFELRFGNTDAMRLSE